MGVTITRSALDVLEQVTFDCTTDGRVLDNYSGRGMYGNQCLALVCDDISDLVRWMFGVANAADGEEELVAESLQELLAALQAVRTRHDSLGLQQVFYWPGIEVDAR